MDGPSVSEETERHEAVSINEVDRVIGVLESSRITGVIKVDGLSSSKEAERHE